MDTRFLSLFKWTLAVGNYLNGQSNKGGAYGFRIDTIERMGDVKSLDTKTTVLAYVIAQVEQELNREFDIPEDEIAEYEQISKLPIA
jgi:diaphanous 1